MNTAFGVTPPHAPNLSELDPYIVRQNPDGATYTIIGVKDKTMTHANIPLCVTAIDDEAFSGCTSLTEIIMTDRVTSLGKGVFTNCSSLWHVKLSAGISYIPAQAFDGCSSLKCMNNGAAWVCLHSNIQKLGDAAFRGCSSIKMLNIDNPCLIFEGSPFDDYADGLTIRVPEALKKPLKKTFGIGFGAACKIETY